MALKHQIQTRIEAMKSGGDFNTPSNYYSDVRKAIFGGRGEQTDQLQWLNAQGDGASEKKISDRWVGWNWGNDSSKRFDQTRRIAHEGGSLF